MLSLKNAAEAIGQPHWVVPPQTTGSYKLMPDDTEFFCDGGEYDRAHGRFFLRWYSQVLIDHGDLILYLARLVFEDTCIAAKVSFYSLYFLVPTKLTKSISTYLGCDSKVCFG